MALHQVLPTPAGFKHRFMHGPTADLLTFRPHNLGVDPLQGLIRTQQQPIEIAADMSKPGVAAEDLAVRHHELLQGGADAD